jgi:hypothetical protein
LTTREKSEFDTSKTKHHVGSVKQLVDVDSVTIIGSGNRHGKTGRVSKPWDPAAVNFYLSPSENAFNNWRLYGTWRRAAGDYWSGVYGDTIDVDGVIWYAAGQNYVTQLAFNLNIPTGGTGMGFFWGGFLWNKYVRNTTYASVLP